MNHDVTPEEKTVTGVCDPPIKYSLPLPKDLDRCTECPYPRVGFICWSPDGSCMKTEVDKFSRPSKGR